MLDKNQFYQNRLEKYLKIKSVIEKSKPNIVGSLQIKKYKNRVKYYHVIKNCKKNSYKYIQKSNIALIRQLAQKKYLKRLEKIVDSALPKLYILSKDEPLSIDRAYLELPEEVKKFVTPLEPTYENLIQKKKELSNSIKSIYLEERRIQTNRGDFVRSKSEKIIADALHFNKIEYFYEYPLIIKNKTFYPDFTFIHRETKREIYWEHFGMMDNFDYFRKSIEKIQVYLSNGLKLYDNLIITTEFSNSVISTSQINSIISFLK